MITPEVYLILIEFNLLPTMAEVLGIQRNGLKCLSLILHLLLGIDAKHKVIKIKLA